MADKVVLPPVNHSVVIRRVETTLHTTTTEPGKAPVHVYHVRLYAIVDGVPGAWERTTGRPGVAMQLLLDQLGSDGVADKRGQYGLPEPGDTDDEEMPF